MKKLAIFDFDGTLFDTVKDVEICINEALSMNGFPTLSSDEIIHRLGGRIDEIISLVLKDKSTPENIDIIRKDYDRLYDASNKENSKPFPGMHELLTKLSKKGIKLAINSNRTSDSIGYFLDKSLHDIDFIVIQGYEEGHPPKPDPYGVDKILSKIDIEKEEILYIGDSLTDVGTAQNAGIDCLIVRWGYGDEQAFESEYILECIDESDEILKYF